MNTNDVVESYVHDVAKRLPLKKRNDVAFELRLLLLDDLQAQAEREGRPPDHDMAVEMLRRHGRPSETAVRYYRAFTIVEPGDTWSFLLATVSGATVMSLLLPPGRTADLAGLAWVGALAIAFGLKSLIVRYRPDAFAWRPRPVRDPDAVNRVRSAALLLTSLALLALYSAPERIMRAVPGDWISTGTLDYTDSFTSALRMPWLIGALIVFAGLQLTITVRGRWRSGLRWARLVVATVAGTQLGWHSRYGMIFEDPDVDELAVVVMGLLAGLVILSCAAGLYRGVGPGPPGTASPLTHPARWAVLCRGGRSARLPSIGTIRSRVAARGDLLAGLADAEAGWPHLNPSPTREHHHAERGTRLVAGATQPQDAESPGGRASRPCVHLP
jgi:hypothetical protein